jgi:hypothetical protein
MTLELKQYDALGRSLDGAKVRLDDAQRAAADEIARLERTIGDKLDAPVPAAAMARVRQQMLAALERQALRPTKPLRNRWRPAWYAGTAVATAAAIALAIWAGMAFLGPQPIAPAPQIATAKLVDPIADLAKMDPMERQFDLLAREISSVAAEMQAPQGTNGIDARISIAEQQIQDFYDDGPPPPPAVVN